MSELFSSETKMLNLATINKNIVRYKVPIAYVGIANKFDFSKEVLEMLRDTIKGSPVLAYYDKNSNDFGGHTDDLYRDKYGNLKITPELREIGFAIYDQDAWWEEFTFDGITREYLTTYVYLWKNRNPYVEDMALKVHQSMEVELDYSIPDDNGIKKVESASFQGMVLLGSTVKPAFQGSTFIKFSSEELEKLKQEYISFKKDVTNFPKQGDNKEISLNNSNYDQFDYEYTIKLKEEYPQIWKKGGNIRGNEAFEYWVKAKNNDTSEGVLDWIKEREAWSARHYKDKNINGIIAQIKWGMVGSRGIDYMKSVVNKEKEKYNDFADNSDDKKIKIEIDNSKESSVSGKWENPESSLYDPILKTENRIELIKEAYLIVEDDYENSPSTSLKYPHHIIKDNKLVIHFKGIQAAFQRARQQDIAKGDVLNHIKRHYKELQLNMDNLKEFDLSEEEFNFIFSEDKSKNKEGSVGMDKIVFSLNSDQIRELMRNNLSQYTYKNGDYEYNKYWVNTYDADYVYVCDEEVNKKYAMKYVLNDTDISIDVNSAFEVIGGNFIPVKKIEFSVENYADMFKEMKEAVETYKIKCSDDKITMIDGENKFVYEMSNDEVKKVPFTENENNEFLLDNEKAENMSTGLDMCKMAAKVIENEISKNSTKDTEMGKVLAQMALMESKMKDADSTIVEKDAKIKELEDKIKTKDDEEKMSKVSELLSKKEFSIFSKEEKEEFSKKAQLMALGEFEDLLYSTFGKKVKDNIDFSSQNQNFSFMYVPSGEPKTKIKSEDIYEEIREKNKLTK